MPNEQSRKWYQKKRYILPSLIFLPPVGIILVWLSRWTRSAKIAATVLSGLIWIGTFAGQPKTPQTTSSPSASPPVVSEVSPVPSESPSEVASPSPKISTTPEPKPTASTLVAVEPDPNDRVNKCGIVRTESTALNVRQSGNADAPVIGTLSNGERITVKHIGLKWLYVSGSSVTGYVLDQYISDCSDTSDQAEPTQIPEQASPIPEAGSLTPIRNSIPGSCQCPYDTDSRGRRCGGRSAHSKPGGESPRCFVGE
ncbi:SH3 domain-containing protein [Coleofasciculus sp. FACHB-129]|uniref:SH3 domain-containing protein n=1 Tax=Cyanophyceae TaxID=3028117 RepID=UPI001685EA1A|nr:SH3 domain-containing protein [Coleofasciculus sp. FACHB-129]MBD1895915.1 SH3 domain-containing protein [Coleofasciculus sp. FACHB-129]